ncbi:MAG TPA: alpha-L-arabinofuranosidase C-terminal domain-containing protein [Opitutaceae bacterium]
MNRIFVPFASLLKRFCLVVLLAFASGHAFAVTENGKATVTINVDKITGEISPLIYGQFVEHLGRAIYGGIYEENSPLSDQNGFRTDVLEKVRALRAPLMRYPGGTVTKIYHWKDGIGPKNERPVRPNLIWGGEDSNHMGTDEFMFYAKLIDAAPFLTVNMATGTAEEASDWVEYCNAVGNSRYAALRRANGHASPYSVKYWGLGNEEAAKEDPGVLQNPEDYVKKAWSFAKLMKLQDPTIQLVMVGDDAQWNTAVLKGLGPICDFLSLHLYASTEPGDPNSLFTSVAKMEERVTTTAAQIRELTTAKVTDFSKWYRFPARQGPVKIALDEWGIWENSGKGAYGLELTYNWNHALGVASFLNMFQRHADAIGLATWAQTVNVLAPIMTDKKSVVCQTIYYPMALYRSLCGTRSVTSSVDCATLPGTEHLPMVDVASSINERGTTLTIAIVNRSATDQVDLEMNVAGATTSGQWTVHELNAASIDATNTLEEPKKNVVTHRTTALPAGNSHYVAAAHSINILQVDLGP